MSRVCLRPRAFYNRGTFLSSSRVALICLAAAGAAAGQQPAPPPPAQHVVVPSLPDQKNKESNVRPTGAMRTDSAGWVVSGEGQTCPKAGAPAARGRAPRTPAPPEQGLLLLPPGPSPTAPTVVEAAHVTLRGTVKAFRPGRSITIVEASGRERTVPLAPKASVYAGARAGDKVSVRIPLQEDGACRAADRVDRQTKAEPPKSKFSQAQAQSSSR